MELISSQKRQQEAYEKKLGKLQDELHAGRQKQQQSQQTKEAGKGALYNADTDEWIEEVLLMKEISEEMLRAEHQLSCRLSRTLEEAAAAEVAATDHDLQIHQNLVNTVEELNRKVSALQNQGRSEVQHLHAILEDAQRKLDEADGDLEKVFLGLTGGGAA